MELKYPDSQCEHSPNKAHLYTELPDGIWQCKYCHAVKWLPRSTPDAMDFSGDIKKLGIQKAYSKLLQHRPSVREALIRIIREGGDAH